MRTLDAHTQERLSRQGRGVCTCWRLTRKDGVIIAITDHDRALSFSGTTFVSTYGADGSALEESVSLGPDNTEIVGVFSADLVKAEDIEAGRFDGALIEVFLVDWEDPNARILQRSGIIGEIEYDGESYRAEFRSLKQGLDRPAGRLFSRRCDVPLGSVACGIDLTSSQLTYDGTIDTYTDRRLTIEGLSGPPTEWFTSGLLRFTSGPLSGIEFSIKQHTLKNSTHEVELWQALPSMTVENESVQLVAGCDKAHHTCRDKFHNTHNFRGFPYIPGMDSLIAYPQSRKSSS